MSREEDGWGNSYSDAAYVSAYHELNYAVWTPLDKIIEKQNINVFRPKYKQQKKHRKLTADEVYRLDLKTIVAPNSDSDDDKENQKIFFRPPLQIQRNGFVNNELLELRRKSGWDITKLCVMGCGEMSLERNLLGILGLLGVKMIVSVDCDEASLSVGHQLLEKSIIEQKSQIVAEEGFPVLMRSFSGNILDADCRFAHADCIVSLEVIEHMPLEDARKFVSLVLGTLRPRMFIFSTPNHDYNKAFGEKPGTFRHDDHKFEMTAAQFHDWIKELRQLHFQYEIADPVYIGLTEGFEHLKGATQAAVCHLRMDTAPAVHHELLPYQAVGQVMIPIGRKPVTFRVVKRAFISWLKATELRESELRTEKFGKFWLINIKKVLHHVHAPVTFAASIDEFEAIEMIKKVTRMRIYSECSKGVNALAIPDYMSRAKILEAIATSGY